MIIFVAKPIESATGDFDPLVELYMVLRGENAVQLRSLKKEIAGIHQRLDQTEEAFPADADEPVAEEEESRTNLSQNLRDSLWSEAGQREKRVMKRVAKIVGDRLKVLPIQQAQKTKCE